MAQDSPKMAQDAPKMPQDGPKMAPRCPKMIPKWPQDVPKMAPNAYHMAPMATDYLCENARVQCLNDTPISIWPMKLMVDIALQKPYGQHEGYSISI